MMQLIDWHTISTPKSLNVIITHLDGHAPAFLFFSGNQAASRTLCDFLQNVSRAGKYAVTADTHANASVRCMQYLRRSHLGPPINLHHTPRNIARRRNSPWHWNRYKKFMNRLPVVVYGKRKHTTTLPDRYIDQDGWKQASSMRENLWEQVDRHQKYTGTTRLGMDFLLYTLPLSAPSNELIALLRAEKSFSQRAAAFPNRFKKCKAAIATYLARVEPKTEPSTRENEGETVISNDKPEPLPVGEESVLVHDRDLGLSERWWMWVARGKTSGVGAEQADGRWGSLGYILKFLLPIFLSFILSVVVSYFS